MLPPQRIRPPGPYSRFPPAEMHAWLDGLQRKIARGIHPPSPPAVSEEDEEAAEDNQAYVEADGAAYATDGQSSHGDESDGIEYIGHSNSPQPPLPNLYPPLPDAPTPYADPGAPRTAASPAVPPLGGGHDLVVEQDAMQIDPNLLQDGYQIDAGFLQDLVHHVSQGMAPPPQEGDAEDYEGEEEEVDGAYDEDFMMSGDEREQARDVEEYSEEEEEEDELVDEPSDEEQESPIKVQAATVREVIEIGSSSEEEVSEDGSEAGRREEDEEVEYEEEEEDELARDEPRHPSWFVDEAAEEEEEEEEEEEGEEEEEEEEEDEQDTTHSQTPVDLLDQDNELERQQEKESLQEDVQGQVQLPRSSPAPTGIPVETVETVEIVETIETVETVETSETTTRTTEVIEVEEMDDEDELADDDDDDKVDIERNEQVEFPSTTPAPDTAVEQRQQEHQQHQQHQHQQQADRGLEVTEIVETRETGETKTTNLPTGKEEAVQVEDDVVVTITTIQEKVQAKAEAEAEGSGSRVHPEPPIDLLRPALEDGPVWEIPQGSNDSTLRAASAPFETLPETAADADADADGDLPDPAAPPPPTSQIAPLSPHSLRPHPPATASVIVQLPPDEPPSRIEDISSTPPSINEREQTPVEFPDPKGAPPDTNTQAPIDPHDLKPRASFSPSLIVEPPADPRPVGEISAVVSRAATPVQFPDPRLPPVDSYLEAPITPHRLEPRSRAPTESLMVEDGQEEGSVAGGTVDGATEIERAPITEPLHVSEVEVEVEVPVPQNGNGTAGLMAFDEDMPMAALDDYDVEWVQALERGTVEHRDEAETAESEPVELPKDAEYVEEEQEQRQKTEFSVGEQAGEDQGEPAEETIELEEPTEDAGVKAPQQDEEDVDDDDDDKSGRKDKGKGKAFSTTPIDEEQVLNDDQPSVPVLVDASPERPPLIMSTSAIERLRHHHTLASGAAAASASQSGQSNQTPSQIHTHKRTRSRARAEGSPPPPPVTRSNCYYEKLKVADYGGLEAVILAPHCSLANTEQIEEDEAVVQGVPTEEEEQEARKCQLSHDNEVLHPALCTKIRRIVGLQIFDEGCCYLLYANKGARLPEPEESSSKKTETPTGTISSRGHRKRKSTSAQLGEQSTTASPLKPRASPLGRSALKRSGASLEPPESLTPRKKSKEPSLEPAGSYTTEVGDDHSAAGSPGPSSTRRLQTPRRSTRLSSVRREEEGKAEHEKELEAVQEGEVEMEEAGQEGEGDKREKTVEDKTPQTPRRSARFLPAEEIDNDPSDHLLGSTTVSQSETNQHSPAESALRKTPSPIREQNNAAYLPDVEDEDTDSEQEEEEETAKEDEESTSEASSKTASKKRKARDESEEEDDQEDEGEGGTIESGTIESRVVKRRALEDEETGTPVSENETGEAAGDGDTQRRGWGKWFRWW